MRVVDEAHSLRCVKAIKNRRQHHLPFAYLRQFSIDPLLGRHEGSTIWRFDGEAAPHEVPTASQGRRGDYFFSRDTELEARAWAFEPNWHADLERVRSASTFSDPELNSVLFAHLMNLHLRSPAFENE